MTYDGGTSLSKIIYRVFRDEQPESVKHLVAQPEVIRLLDPSFLQNIEQLSSEISGWLQLPPRKEKKYYAVGKLASDLGATSSIRSLKHFGFVPKILAAVGAIAVSEKLLPDTFTLSLCCLLPYSEYGNGSQLEAALKSALKGYWFSGHRIKANLAFYKHFPEGVGLALEVKRRLGADWKKLKRAAVLIFGYRNTSCLFFDQGDFSPVLSTSTDYGFYHLLDFAAQKLPGISREKIQETIVTTTEEYVDVQQQKRLSRLLTLIDYSRLLVETSPAQRNKHLEIIKSALSAAKFHYWQLISKFLYEVECSGVNVIYYGGGSSIFIKDKLFQYCNERNIPLVSSSELDSVKSQSNIQTLPPLIEILNLNSYERESFITQNLGVRFADVWNLFVNTTHYEQEYFQNLSA